MTRRRRRNRFQRECAVERCTERQWLKGYCQRHYFHIRRHGVPGMAYRRHSVREAIEVLISDPVVTMDRPEWTVGDLAQRVRCCHSVATEAVTALYQTNHLTRRRLDGGYQQLGTYTYRWAG